MIYIYVNIPEYAEYKTDFIVCSGTNLYFRDKITLKDIIVNVALISHIRHSTYISNTPELF